MQTPLKHRCLVNSILEFFWTQRKGDILILTSISNAESLNGSVIHVAELHAMTLRVNHLNLLFAFLLFFETGVETYHLDKHTLVLTGTDTHASQGTVSYGPLLSVLIETQNHRQRGEPTSTHVGILLICWKRSIIFLFKKKTNKWNPKEKNPTTNHRNRQVLNLLDKPPLKHRQAQFHEMIFPTDLKQTPCCILAHAMYTSCITDYFNTEYLN